MSGRTASQAFVRTSSSHQTEERENGTDDNETSQCNVSIVFTDEKCVMVFRRDDMSSFLLRFFQLQCLQANPDFEDVDGIFQIKKSPALVMGEIFRVLASMPA